MISETIVTIQYGFNKHYPYPLHSRIYIHTGMKETDRPIIKSDLVEK